MAANYDPNWMKAPLLIDHDFKVGAIESKTNQFSLGYFSKISYDAEKEELWGWVLGNEEAVTLAKSGLLTSGSSVFWKWIPKLTADKHIEIIPYLMHVASLGKDNPAMPGTDSISDAFACTYAYKLTKIENQTEGGFTMADTPKEPDGKPADTPPEGEPKTLEIPSEITSLLDRKALGKLSQAVTDAVKGGGDVAGATAKMNALLASTLKEIQSLCSTPAEGSPDDPASPNEEAQDTAFKALQEENLKLRDLILDDKLAQVSLSDSDKTEFKAGLGTVPLETALKMLDLSIGQSLRAGTPTTQRFTDTSSVAPSAPKEPKTVAELDALQPAGFAAFLKNTFPEFADADFDAEEQFKIKRADLLKTDSQPKK